MATRIQTVKLGHHRVGVREEWHVLVVKNSTDYKPGDALDKATVDDLCRSTRWDVTIVTYHPEMHR